ncbi:polysaccharide biosynthesis protein [Halomonas rhizosphaerae]|uniref:Nucleoside-diphosphate sugar epimerase/dehydratase n=1 Tax=Halomonas rhizosphaerae TaxID=3043296 RepID=A0ABT6V0W3_9GAMM|nr:nucleoside-diphosphate sugar epimerase/dehydratase [Halomonas rhizosphaerae]MDI5891871.1 nucleoside-diphosphate sugar epimerase/dehydratase [Halomonas rhizosphaerae]
MSVSAWLEALVRLPRRIKRQLLRVADTLLVGMAMLMAILLVGDAQTLLDGQTAAVTVPVVLAAPLCFEPLGIYRVVLRYMNRRVIQAMIAGITFVSAGLVLLNLILGQPLAMRVVPVFAILALAGIGGLRMMLQELYQLSCRTKRKPVVIFGAGAAGCELARALQQGGHYWPRAFVDDWRGLQGSLVEGLRVHPPAELAGLVERLDVELVLLAIPSAPRCRRREILEDLAELSIPVQTIPGTEDLVSGRALVNETRDVAVEDLLGREPVPPFPDLMAQNIRGKVVLVTGAGGSIGSELCRQILWQEPRRLVLVDSCEFALYSIEQELLSSTANSAKPVCRAALLSIQQQGCLEALMRREGVQTLYHAAAYKHVPLVESNLIEGIRNNVFGTLGLVKAAVAAGVESFVMVSTDKAVRPSNVMGATKRLTELICQAFASRYPEEVATRLCMVRFGNVLGSSGSVVPRFREQIARGGPVEVTHAEITRYFMTIPEAAQLVIQAGAMGEAGEVFVLDMGEPVRIADLAMSMIRLSGLEVKSAENPGGDIEIRYTGLRPGEKLYEELMIGDDARRTRHPRILTTRERYWPWERLEPFLGLLEEAVESSEEQRVITFLRQAPLDYRPGPPMPIDVIEAQESLQVEAASVLGTAEGGDEAWRRVSHAARSRM